MQTFTTPTCTGIQPTDRAPPPPPPPASRRAGGDVRRVIAKSLSWQALGLCTTMLTAFLLTGSLAMGGAMALSSAVIGTVMFVLHERAWDHVGWGKGS